MYGVCTTVTKLRKVAIVVAFFVVMFLIVMRLNPRMPLSDSNLLEFATRRKWCSVVATQLALGADPNAPGWRPPLIEAVFRNDLGMATTLVEHGADLNRRWHSGEPDGPPLAWALYLHRTEIAKMLLRHGANPDYRPVFDSTTVFDLADELDDPELMELMRAKGHRPDLKH